MYEELRTDKIVLRERLELTWLDLEIGNGDILIVERTDYADDELYVLLVIFMHLYIGQYNHHVIMFAIAIIL